MEAARPPLPLHLVEPHRQRGPRAHDRHVRRVPALALNGHRAAARGDRLPAEAAEKAAAGLCARRRGLVPSLRHGRSVGLWLGRGAVSPLCRAHRGFAALRAEESILRQRHDAHDRAVRRGDSAGARLLVSVRGLHPCVKRLAARVEHHRVSCHPLHVARLLFAEQGHVRHFSALGRAAPVPVSGDYGSIFLPAPERKAQRGGALGLCAPAHRAGRGHAAAQRNAGRTHKKKLSGVPLSFSYIWMEK